MITIMRMLMIIKLMITKTSLIVIRSEMPASKMKTLMMMMILLKSMMT